jgi:hypothetical protein
LDPLAKKSLLLAAIPMLAIHAYTVLDPDESLPDAVVLTAADHALRICSSENPKLVAAEWPWGEVIEITSTNDAEGALLSIARRGLKSEQIVHEFETEQCEEKTALLFEAWQDANREAKLRDACKTRKFQSNRDWTLPEAVEIASFTALKSGAGKGRMTFDLVPKGLSGE